MTAKHRGEPADPLDYGKTPDWATRAIIPRLGTPSTILDLGCGDGAIGLELRKAWQKATIMGVEMDPTRRAAAAALRHGTEWVYDGVLEGDVREVVPDLAFDAIVANPPFSQAVDFFHVAMQKVRPGGTVAFLLRGMWLVPELRRDIPRADLHFLRRRPSFKTSQKGNTQDSADYAWTLWKQSDPFSGGRYEILECEPGPRALARMNRK